MSNAGKPVLLKAVETLLAEPCAIHDEAQSLLRTYRKSHPDEREDVVRNLAAKKIIKNYSYYAAFSGGATALAGVVPGLGTAVAAFGGSAADAALSMKYQIEMTMALASVYGHDILIEEQRRICLIVAGLGTITEAGKDGGRVIGTKAFIAMTQQYLRGSTLQAVKEVFKTVGITFTRKAAEKAIPFGVGVVIGFTANKGLTWYVGKKAQQFFATN